MYAFMYALGSCMNRKDMNGELKRPFPPLSYRSSLTQLVVPGKGSLAQGYERWLTADSAGDRQ